MPRSLGSVHYTFIFTFFVQLFLEIFWHTLSSLMEACRCHTTPAQTEPVNNGMEEYFTFPRFTELDSYNQIEFHD